MHIASPPLYKAKLGIFGESKWKAKLFDYYCLSR